MLAALYFDGRGVRQDRAAAYRWYQKSAERDDAIAMFKLYGMLIKGEGTAVDAKRAKAYLQRSAELGNRKAVDTMQSLHPGWTAPPAIPAARPTSALDNLVSIDVPGAGFTQEDFRFNAARGQRLRVLLKPNAPLTSYLPSQAVCVSSETISEYPCIWFLLDKEGKKITVEEYFYAYDAPKFRRERTLPIEFDAGSAIPLDILIKGDTVQFKINELFDVTHRIDFPPTILNFVCAAGTCDHTFE
jgi:hypothetical protein